MKFIHVILIWLCEKKYYIFHTHCKRWPQKVTVVCKRGTLSSMDKRGMLSLLFQTPFQSSGFLGCKQLASCAACCPIVVASAAGRLASDINEMLLLCMHEFASQLFQASWRHSKYKKTLPLALVNWRMGSSACLSGSGTERKVVI